MAERPMEPEDPRLTAAARHALHDEELVAAFAVDGEAADDPSRARTLIERCTTCRDLHADLVAIGAVVRSAEKAEAVATVRPAPRDYRLTASDAVRLRGGNSLQRVAARLIDAIATFGRPLGASVAALGVVGLLVGSVTLGSLGGTASMPLGAPGAQAPAATHERGAVNGAAASPAMDLSTPEPEASTAREEFTLAGEDNALGSDGTSLLFAGSITLVVVGAALLLAGSRRHRPALARSRGRT